MIPGDPGATGYGIGMWWWLCTALAATTPAPLDARGEGGDPPGREEPLDLGRVRESGDVPLLTDLPTSGRLGPLRVRVGRQKSPFLASYIEDVRSVPLVQRPMTAAGVDADRLVGGRVQWRQGPVQVTAATGHPDNLRGVAWDTLGRVELHTGPVHVGVGGGRGAHARFTPRVIVADRFRWLEVDPKSVVVRRSSADVAWNPAPLRLDAEAATLSAGGKKKGLQVRSASAGAAVMLTGEKRPVDARVVPYHPWDPERGHIGAVEVAARVEHLQARGDARIDVEQVSAGLTAHPLSSVRLPLVYSRAWTRFRTEDRVMLRVSVDR